MLRFDEATHTYWVERNGSEVRVPSVTQVLSATGIIDDTWYASNPTPTERGTAIHEAIAFDIRGVLDDESLDERVRPYVKQWRAFLREQGVEVLESERMVYDAGYGYAGRLDAIVQFPREEAPTLLDVKTGAKAAWHALQTAGYQAAMYEYLTRGCLYLAPDGYKWDSHSDDNDRPVFYAAVAVYNWRANHGGF